MSGSASLSAAKRRRAGGSSTSTTNFETNNSIENVSIPRASNITEAVQIHDSILVNCVKYINMHTSQFNAVNETLKKVGENENGIHERLAKLETMVENLMNQRSKSPLLQPVDEDTIKEEVSQSIKEEVSQSVEDSVDNDANIMEGTVDDNIQDDTSDVTPKGTYRNNKKSKRKKGNNISMKIEEA